MELSYLPYGRKALVIGTSSRLPSKYSAPPTFPIAVKSGGAQLLIIMPDIFHRDYETYSPADLRNCGQYKYAEHPDARILMDGVSRHGEEPLIYVPADSDPDGILSDPGAEELVKEISEKRDSIVVAHNVYFENAVAKYRHKKDTGYDPPSREQYRCTAAMARVAALPHHLGKLAEFLKLPQQKDTKGAALIRLFSIPDKKTGKRVMAYDRPEEFKVFMEYCRQDVRTESSIFDALSKFQLTGDLLKTFQVDLAINDRGIPVNVEALHTAFKLVVEILGDCTERFRHITGFNPTQTAKILGWFRDMGYPYENMQADTVTRALEHTGWAYDEDTVEALRLKQASSYAAVKKIPAMLRYACSDSRIRGTLYFYGAGPGRWSAKGVQPQNFKRPEFRDTAQAYEYMKKGDLDTLTFAWGNPLKAISSSIRHFIGDELTVVKD